MSHFRFSIANCRFENPIAVLTIGNWQLEMGNVYPAIFSLIICK